MGSNNNNNNTNNNNVDDKQLAEASLLSYFSHCTYQEQLNLKEEGLRTNRACSWPFPTTTTSANLNSNNKNNGAGRPSCLAQNHCVNPVKLDGNSNTINGGGLKELKFVAVHLGAGTSNKLNEKLYNLAKKVCEDVMSGKAILKYNNDLRFEERTSFSTEIKTRKRYISESHSFQNTHHPNPVMSAETASALLVKMLEDNRLLNCGFGSNLNINGQVECDASLMCDRMQLWSGVGSVSGCKNPILLAHALYKSQTVERPLNLVQPNLLVSNGAKQWMKKHCPHLLTSDSKLISARALRTYQRIKSDYDAAVRTKKIKLEENIDKTYSYRNSFAQRVNKPNCKETMIDKNNGESSVGARCEHLDHDYCRSDWYDVKSGKPSPCSKHLKREASQSSFGSLDTVGAVVIDKENNYASSISSGGLLLKYKGRLGQAAVPGAGCWARNSIAVATSGVGEYLTTSMLARSLYEKIQTVKRMKKLGYLDAAGSFENEALLKNAISECFEDFLYGKNLSHIEPNEKLAAILSISSSSNLSQNNDNGKEATSSSPVYLSYAHNTKSMYIGYMSCDSSEAKVLHSLRSESAENGAPEIQIIKIFDK